MRLLVSSLCLIFLGWATSCQERTGTPAARNDDQQAFDALLRQVTQQPTAADSLLGVGLERSLQSSPDSVRAARLTALSYTALNSAGEGLFREINRLAREEAYSLQDSSLAAVTHWDMAEFLYGREVMDSAYYHFYQAQQLYEATGKTFNSGRMLLNMAVVQGKMRDYTGSEITTFRAIEKFAPLQRHWQLFLSYNNLGSITKELGEFERAIDFYNRASEHLLAAQRKDDYARLSLLNNMGVVYQEMGDHERAMDNFRQVREAPGMGTERPDL